jgi:3-hydroxybutyryl-CoA dehydrogenase
MKQIAVIGSGTMGNGIAQTFAQAGFAVKLIDISEKSLEKGMATIAANLDRMVTKGTITEDDKIKTIDNRIKNINNTKIIKITIQEFIKT